MLHYLWHATAALAARRQHVHSLHHADIFMAKRMAMHNKASNGVEIKMSPKGDGSERGRIDVYCRSIIGRLSRPRRLWCWTGRNCTRHNEGVVPFGPGEGYIVDLSHQNWILMDVEWMVRK